MKTETWIAIGAVCNMLTPLFWLLLKYDFQIMRRDISTLEKNTNSIKDALIKTTGEAEHAKGVIQGRQENADIQSPRR